jgi:hypothetical protein
MTLLQKVNWWKTMWFPLIVVCGMYPPYAAFSFNSANADNTQNGLVIGVEFAALTAGTILLSTFIFKRWQHRANIVAGLAEGMLWFGCWVALMTVVIMNSASFLKSGRAATDVAAGNQLLVFDTAEAAYYKAKADLEERHHWALWDQTQGCATKQTRAGPKAFCDQIADLKAEIAKYEPIVMRGRPAPSNSKSQYGLLARWTGRSEAELAEDVPVMQAVVLELASMVFSIAFQMSSKPSSERKPPHKRKRKAASRRKPAQQKPLSRPKLVAKNDEPEEPVRPRPHGATLH